MSAQTINQLLRDPAEVARRCEEDDGLRDLVQTSLAVLAFGGAAFGAVLGTFRGDVQIVFAATKVPLALLAALLVSAPARLHLENVRRLHALRDQDEQHLSELADLAEALRTQLLLARYQGASAIGVGDIVTDMWARVEGLGEAMSQDPVAEVG